MAFSEFRSYAQKYSMTLLLVYGVISSTTMGMLYFKQKRGENIKCKLKLMLLLTCVVVIYFSDSLVSREQFMPRADSGIKHYNIFKKLGLTKVQL